MNDYQAYLLRLQRHPERSNWQVTLENIHTREVQYFASMEETLCYLERYATPSDNQIDNSRNDTHFDLT